jgi:hypothetical protein
MGADVAVLDRNPRRCAASMRYWAIACARCSPHAKFMRSLRNAVPRYLRTDHDLKQAVQQVIKVFVGGVGGIITGTLEDRHHKRAEDD